MSMISESSRSSSNESIIYMEKSDEEVRPEVKLAINIVLSKFSHSNDNKELEFPTSFGPIERSYVHKMCRNFGLISATRGYSIKNFNNRKNI